MPSLNKPSHGEVIIDQGKATEQFQAFIDDIGDLPRAIQLPVYTVATVPNATKFEGHTIYVSDGSLLGGPVLAFSDGTDWLRCTDGLSI